MSKVLVREEIAEAGIRLLRERGFEVDVDGDSDLAETIGRYDAIIVRSATKVTAGLIARADNLKVIGRAGVGIDNVDVEAATRRGIVVANAPESTVISAAEHTIGLLVALTRNIPQAHAALKQGRWERKTYGGVELADKTLGVLGFGVGELDGVVLAGADGLGQVEADLLGVDVERGDELQVGDVVVAELDVHQAGDLGAGLGVLVVLDALDEGRRAVADADDGGADGVAGLVPM